MGEVLRIGAAFRNACLRQGYGEVHSTFRRVVNISFDGELLALALPEAGGSSRFLTLDSLHPFEPGTPCWFRPHEFEVAGLRFDLTKVPVWAGPLHESSSGPLCLDADAASEFKGLLARHQITPGADAGFSIEPETVIRWLGLGPGLTPSGDDVLLGFLAFYQEFGGDHPWIEELKSSICSQLDRTTDLSAQLLRSACARDYHEFIQRMIAALAGLPSGPPSGPPPLEGCFEALLAVGASSGQDMLFGMGEALARLETESHLR